MSIIYIALYRKYRPKVFEEVVGQEHITKTLKNQVKNSKIAHAYLFNGPRGTGKTSAAKILSRSVNCLSSNNGDPCNECEVCRGILDGSIMDVVEIDAASNNSVDNVRDIRDEIIYTPTKAKYKVYIIDEVHMLSTGAFNALLKTLEEPPSHIIFILATTEPHKLPATIVSRCQRFDFKKIPTYSISKRLEEVTKDVGAKVENRALDLIAHLSEGGMRDALSILDQSLSLGKDNITHQDILLMVGMVDNDIMLQLSEGLNKKDVRRCIEIINKVSEEGKDLNQFIVRMLNYYRNLLMTKVLDNVDNIVDISGEETEKLKSIVQNYTKEEIMNTIEILSGVLGEAKWSNYAKTLIEMAIIRLCNNTERIEVVYQEPVKTKEAPKKESEKAQEKVPEKETKREEKTKEEKPKNSLGGIAKEVSDNWSKILDDLRAKGIPPLRIQCLNNVIIKPLSENSVLCCFEHNADIHAKLIEDKKLVFDLTDSILKVVGKEIGIRFDSKKQVEKEQSEIDVFKAHVQKQGMEKLIKEI